MLIVPVVMRLMLSLLLPPLLLWAVSLEPRLQASPSAACFLEETLFAVAAAAVDLFFCCRCCFRRRCGCCCCCWWSWW